MTSLHKEKEKWPMKFLKELLFLMIWRKIHLRVIYGVWDIQRKCGKSVIEDGEERLKVVGSLNVMDVYISKTYFELGLPTGTIISCFVIDLQPHFFFSILFINSLHIFFELLIIHMPLKCFFHHRIKRNNCFIFSHFNIFRQTFFFFSSNNMKTW